MIVCGDFLQLPPVRRTGEIDYGYAFQGEAWSRIFVKNQHHALRHVFRQTDDTFVRILEDLRKGIVRDETERTLSNLQTPRRYVDGRRPIEM